MVNDTQGYIKDKSNFKTKFKQMLKWKSDLQNLFNVMFVF